MKTTNPTKQQLELKEELIGFLKSINFKDCFELENLFPNDPDLWNESRTLEYSFKQYKILVDVSAEFTLEENLDSVDQEMIGLEIESSWIETKDGKLIDEEEVFGFNFLEMETYLNNPYLEYKISDKEFRGDIQIQFSAKTKKHAQIIMKKVTALIDEKADDISWVFEKGLNTKEELLKVG